MEAGEAHKSYILTYSRHKKEPFDNCGLLADKSAISAHIACNHGDPVKQIFPNTFKNVYTNAQIAILLFHSTIPLPKSYASTPAYKLYKH